MQPSPQPENSKRRLGENNLRDLENRNRSENADSSDVFSGRHPDPELNTSTTPKGYLPGMPVRRGDQLDRRLQREPDHPPSSTWHSAPIGEVDGVAIINSARYEARKIVQLGGHPHRTEGEQLAEQKGRVSELDQKGSFVLSTWAINGLSALGMVGTVASLYVTLIFVKAKGGEAIGSPALAFSAATLGAFAASTWAIGHLGHKYLHSKFHDKLFKPLSLATSATTMWDKMEWIGTLVGNIDRMNPVLFGRSRTSWTDYGDKFRLAYWKDIARRAAAFAHSKCSRDADPDLVDLQDAAVSSRINRMLNPAQPGSPAPGMSEFLGNLEKRWLRITDWFQKSTGTVGAIGCLMTAPHIRTIIEHSSKFNRYGEFVVDMARALLGGIGL